MKEEYRHIHTLLERFFEGETSNREEQELYRFFDRNDIPEEFSKYKPVIQYFKSGFAVELEATPVQHFTVDNNVIARRPLRIKQLLMTSLRGGTPWQSTTKQQYRLPRAKALAMTRKGSSKLFSIRKQRLLWSAAASVLLILFSSLYLLMGGGDPYEGSYIIRNGIRITDVNQIRSELIATERTVLAQLNEAEKVFEQLFDMDDRLEKQIMQIMEEHNHRIIENFQDENNRREAEQILYQN